MQMVNRLILAAALMLTPVAVLAQAVAPTAPMAAAPASPTAPTPAAPTAGAPTTPPAAAVAPAATLATTATAPAAADRPTFEYARPEAGIGQPVSGGMDFQPQVTENGQFAHWMNNVILLPVITIISLFVLGLMMWITARYRAKANPVPSKTTHNVVIEVIWTLVPVLILAAIAVPSIDLLARQYAPPPADAVTIKVTGYQWYWGYQYPDHAIPEYVSNMLDAQTAAARGEPAQLAVDNRMVVPIGRTIKLIVTGSDVIHSFAVPSLWTKMDAVPGRLNEVTFRAERTGVYYGQCSELCGINHGFMPIAVEVVTQARFAEWVASKGGTMPSAVPAAPAAAAPTPATAAPATASPTPPATAPVAAAPAATPR